MRLGLNLGYQTAWSKPADHLAMAQEADRLGYSVVWAAEAYGSDSPTMLAWIAGQTERIDVGSAVMQIPARTPAMTAMTAATLDTISGGRFRLGLGVSGPQVSEGWHGVRFGKPLGRTREYVEIVKMALDRKVVAFDGEHYTLPLPDGPGKALRMTVHPIRAHLPIYLAAVGPKNLELAGEIADGWLAIFYAPDFAAEQLACIAAGRAREGLDLTGFDVVPSVPVVIGEDVASCAELVRWYAALYLGGMGSREKNFYNDLAVRMGYGDAAREVQDLYLAKRQRDAAAAIPLEFIDRTSLLGPIDRVADKMREYAASGVTTLAVSLFVGDREDGVRALRQIAEALDKSGVGESGMEIWKAIILGIVEGITEFLPISSTGHLTIAEKLLNLTIGDPGVTAYTAIIQVGAIIAAIIYFWRDIVRIVAAFFRGLFSAPARQTADWRLSLGVIVGSIPIAVIGLAAKSFIEGPLRSLWVVAGGLIVWSGVMVFAERAATQQRGEASVTPKDGLIIGLVQCFALIPGVSRSGATISAGLLRDLDRVSATRLSFFLGIPALTAAGVLEAVSARHDIAATVGWVPTIVGTVVSFVVAYATIAWLLKFVAHHTLIPFVWYRVLLGAALVAALATGAVAAT